MVLKEVNCNLCGQKEGKTIESDSFYRVVKCRNCGLVYVTPHPDRDKLFAHYDDAYYQLWIKAQAMARERMWRKRLAGLEQFKETGRLLDIGCGTGLFLKIAKENGWKVQGTEVSSFAVKRAKADFDINVFRGEVLEAKFNDNFFDVVTLWHVLEHTFDPLAYLKEAKRVLKPQGVLIVAVPNINNYIYKIAYRLLKFRRPKLFYQNLREVHLYHFSHATMRNALDIIGFEILNFEVDTGNIFFKDQCIDFFSGIIYKLFGFNIAGAMEVTAQKPHI